MQVPRRLIAPLLSVMLLGVAPAPVNAATTINGAVVAIATTPDINAGYRLTGGKATYLATFGSGNSDALVTATGGCAIKSGNISCYGMAGTVGDGTNRNRPLAVPVTLPGDAQAVEIVEATIKAIWVENSEGDFTIPQERLMCAQGSTAVYCWGDNAGQISLAPIEVYSGTTRLFTGSVLQAEDGGIFHWEPIDFTSATSSYMLTKLAGSVEELAANDITSIHSALGGFDSWAPHVDGQGGQSRLSANGSLGVCVTSAIEIRCLASPVRRLMNPRVADLFPPIGNAAPLGPETTLTGVPLPNSEGVGFCTYLELVISCSESAVGTQFEEIDDLDNSYGGGASIYRPTQMTPAITLPAGSSDPVVLWSPDSGNRLACAVHPTQSVVCAAAAEGENYDIHDVDDDGFISIGREFSLDCGVGFSCAFTPTKLRVSGAIVTAVGTLVRTPRAPAAISGTVRFPDGIPLQGSITWTSSDGKLVATSAIATDGTFTLAARSGMGSITLYRDWGDMPATCLDGSATAGCVTDAAPTIYLDSLVANSNVDITVPSYAGEMRTIDLRFGDGETPIADVTLKVVDPGAECTTTTVVLGRMVSCASQGYGVSLDSGQSIKTGADGTVTLWMPTAMDSVLRVSAADEYGLTWTDDIVSLGDDGASPEPFSFAGLLFAEPLGSMSVRQGSTGTVSALVSVDGIDPAYGLNAGIKPFSTVAKTCASERRTDATDENGLVDFSLCPAGTQLWKVYATDGSFFPSAAFPVTIDPALTRLRISGATLDTAFSGGTTTYTGRFTSSRVTFTPTKASWARSARVTTPTCSRPSRRKQVCTMSVRIGTSTITYKFTLRR